MLPPFSWSTWTLADRVCQYASVLSILVSKASVLYLLISSRGTLSKSMSLDLVHTLYIDHVGFLLCQLCVQRNLSIKDTE